jgi:hypothetical protein
VAVLAERVVGFAGQPHELAGRRHDGPAQRLAGVHRVQQTHVVGGDSERQQHAAGRDRGALVVGQLQHAVEVGQLSEPVARLPAPVVPVGIRHGRVEAAPEFAGERVVVATERRASAR